MRQVTVPPRTAGTRGLSWTAPRGSIGDRFKGVEGMALPAAPDPDISYQFFSPLFDCGGAASYTGPRVVMLWKRPFIEGSYLAH